MTRTLWWCEQCHASGVFEPEASVYDAIEQLRVLHNAHPCALASGSPCTFSTAAVRVSEVSDGAKEPHSTHGGA